MENSQIKNIEMSKNVEECKKGKMSNNSLHQKSYGLLSERSFKTKNELPLRPMFLSFFLFTVGTCFLYLGSTLLISKKYYDSAPTLVLGIFCFIPGSYYSFSIIQILRGVSGYSFDELDIS